MGDIKVIMFDLGNVIICFDHMIAAEEIAKYSSWSADEIYNLFFHSELTEKFDMGQIDEDRFYKAVRRILNLDGLSKDRFYQIWSDIFWENPGIAEVIKEVKDKYEKFFIISNVNKVHFEYIWKKFPIVRKADDIILSYKVGALKPDPKIYKVAIKKAGCRLDQILYIDDRPDLVQGGMKVGLKAIRFRNIDQIRELLL
jgi:putative hydrolase of the HAD superfamily